MLVGADLSNQNLPRQRPAQNPLPLQSWRGLINEPHLIQWQSWTWIPQSWHYHEKQGLIIENRLWQRTQIHIIEPVASNDQKWITKTNNDSKKYMPRWALVQRERNNTFFSVHLCRPDLYFSWHVQEIVHSRLGQSYFWFYRKRRWVTTPTFPRQCVFFLFPNVHMHQWPLSLLAFPVKTGSLHTCAPYTTNKISFIVSF